uniref:Uncharacterized protein n=1 Tax=Arundo donax TaxID=35708 RepID=A0A0A9EJY8_ARUDO
MRNQYASVRAGGDLFLFYFDKPNGVKRALEDGPWNAGSSLMMLSAYDGRKELEELEFNHIPIWIRVSQLLMGMMNKAVAEIIGIEVGTFLDVDVGENGTTAGHFLRVKVHIDIRMCWWQKLPITHAAWEICLAQVQIQWYAANNPRRASQFSLQTNKVKR